MTDTGSGKSDHTPEKPHLTIKDEYVSNGQGLKFHYDREDRLSRADRMLGKVPTGPWYRKNRGMAILLIDIIIIVAIYFLYTLVLNPDFSSLDIEGMNFELKVFETEDLLVNINITVEDAESELAGKLVEIAFSYEHLEESKLEDLEYIQDTLDFELIDVLPAASDPFRTIRTSVPGPKAEVQTKLYCYLLIEERVYKLESFFRNES